MLFEIFMERMNTFWNAPIPFYMGRVFILVAFPVIFTAILSVAYMWATS